MEATSSRQHTVNGTRNAFWKSPMTSSGCWRSSTSRIACMRQHDAQYRELHNPAVHATPVDPGTVRTAGPGQCAAARRSRRDAGGERRLANGATRVELALQDLDDRG